MNKLKSLMKFLRGKQNTTADIAKERLKIIISHEHTMNDICKIQLPQLKQELMQVIAKYIAIDESKVNVQLENDDNISVLELSIVLDKNSSIILNNKKNSK